MDPPHCEWRYDENAQAIVATTTMVVGTYFYPDRMHEGVDADVQPTSVDVPTAYLGQPLGPWDFPPEPLPDVEMEPMSPELLTAEPSPQPVITMIELSAMTSRGTTAASPLYPEYHPEAAPTFEEDPSEEQSSMTSCAPYQVEPSHRSRRIEVLSLHPPYHPHTLYTSGSKS